MNQNFPKPIKVTACYDHVLEAITGKCEEVAWISEGMPFLMFLATIFRSYPEIEVLHPPGVLGFAVNGEPPGEFDVLHDGDRIEFSVHRNL